MATELSILLKLDGANAVTQGLSKVEQSFKQWSDKMVSAGKTMSLAVTAPLTAFAVIGVKELSSVQAAMAQTEAAIRSTGGAAGISAKGVRELAATLQQKSAVDAEVIQSGANLLLTFTNIRNVAGANNDIFNRANKVALDLSRSFGQDLKSSAIQLGKALNDPIQGVSALSRVGVQFTDVQKNQIKALVESGKTLEAQKIILAELETQVGGSAEAYSKTLGGSLELMKINVEDLAGSLVEALQPAITSIIAFAMKWLNWFNSLDESTKSIIATIGVLVAAIGPLLFVIGKAITTFKLLGTTIAFVMNLNPYILAIGSLITAGVLLYQNWDNLSQFADIAWKRIKIAIMTAVKEILEVLAILEKDASGVMGRIVQAWISPISHMVEIGIKMGEDLRNGLIKGLAGIVTGAFKFGSDWGTGIAEGQEGPISDSVTFLEGKIQEQKELLTVASKNINTLGTSIETIWAAAPKAIEPATVATTALADSIEKRVIPEFYNLASVQREMAKKGMPELTAQFVNLEEDGLQPTDRAFGKMKLTTSLLSRTYFPELTKQVDNTGAGFTDLSKEVITSQSVMEVAVRKTADTVKGLWNKSTQTWKDVWHGALDVFVDTMAQMVVQAQIAGTAIKVEMAAAMGAVGLIVGVLGMLLSGKQTTIKVEPLTDRLKVVFDDFISKFKGALGQFKNVLFPQQKETQDTMKTIDTIFEAIRQAESLRGKLTGKTEEVGESFWSTPFSSNKKDYVVQTSELKDLRENLNEVLKEINMASLNTSKVWVGWAEKVKAIKIPDLENIIVALAKKLGDTAVSLTSLLVDRFNEIKSIVNDITNLYKAQQSFSKDVDKSITDVSRSLYSPDQLFQAQVNDVNELRTAVAAATGQEQISLLSELKTAYLTVWESAKSLFAGDETAVTSWQNYVLQGLEEVRNTGVSAYDQLIDINLEILGIQRDGRDMQSQMNEYLSSLDSNIVSALTAIQEIGQSGTASAENLAYISTAISRLFEIPKMAAGGIVTKPTIALIGEAGPEAIVPLKTRKAGNLQGDNGGVIIRNTYNGPVILDELTMRKWTRKQMRMIRQESLRYA